MQLLGTPLARAVALAALLVSSWALAPPGMAVDFSRHGSDWAQGNCAARGRQSPIDLNELFKPPSSTFEYRYAEVSGRDVNISNDGRMISAKLAGGSLGHIGGLALELNGQPTWFNLSSIDVKSESEHTFRGKHYPLEIQLTHRPAHYHAAGGGPEAVTVSIFVDCPTPPKAKQVWPGLIQKTGGRLRGKKQMPENDSLMPLVGNSEADEEEDLDPMHQRMDAEVSFVRNLAEGEDALEGAPAAAPAGAPAGAPGLAGAPGAAEEVYTAPSPMDANYNPLLQFLVQQEPPDLDSSVATPAGGDTPLRLGSLLAGGTYFYYWGSSTLPPCAEKDLWLIKREVVMASKAQVSALYDTLHLMSSGAGNYRTGMPLNQRPVQVLAGKDGFPRQLQTFAAQTVSKAPGKEQKYINMAKDAITIAKAASDYAKDIDWRIQAGSTAHLRAMEEPEPTLAPVQTTNAFIPKNPAEQQIWATNIMSNVVRQGIKEALKENIDEMIPATVSLAGSYLRQRILKKAGFGPPPVGAKVHAPIPIPGVPTFFPPVEYTKPSKENLTALADHLIAAGCTAETNYSGCANITGLSSAQAKALSDHMAATSEDKEDTDVDANQMTPEQVQQTLPPGVKACPAAWPDPDGWPSGMPPANYPAGADLSIWPSPDGAKPAGWSAYKWERYKWNWSHYRSSYLPYKSSYRGYSFSRRRRASRYGSARRRSYSSSRRSSSYSSSRRRASSRSSRRRRATSRMSSGRRRRGR